MGVLITNVGDEFSELHSKWLGISAFSLFCFKRDTGLENSKDWRICDESGNSRDISALPSMTASAVEKQVECSEVFRAMVIPCAESLKGLSGCLWLVLLKADEQTGDKLVLHLLLLLHYYILCPHPHLISIGAQDMRTTATHKARNSIKKYSLSSVAVGRRESHRCHMSLFENYYLFLN